MPSKLRRGVRGQLALADATKHLAMHQEDLCATHRTSAPPPHRWNLFIISHLRFIHHQDALQEARWDLFMKLGRVPSSLSP